MNNNKIFESTNKCVYLEIPLHDCTLSNDMSSTVRDFNKKKLTIYSLISLLLIAIHYHSDLFGSYCMPIYGSQMFKFYDKNSVNCIYVSRRGKRDLKSET